MRLHAGDSLLVCCGGPGAGGRQLASHFRHASESWHLSRSYRRAAPDPSFRWG